VGTHYRGTEAEERALDAFIKLMRAANSVRSRVHAHLTEARLTESQFGVLEALLHLGPLCQKELSEKLLKSGANTTTVVDNLEKRGLVRRERRGSDRRYVSVHLTPEGGALVARAFSRHVNAVLREFGRITPEEQEQLASLCRELGRGVPPMDAEAGGK